MQGAGGGELIRDHVVKNFKQLQSTNQQKHETGINKHTPAETAQTYQENCAMNHERTDGELYAKHIQDLSFGQDSQEFKFKPKTQVKVQSESEVSGRGLFKIKRCSI